MAITSEHIEGQIFKMTDAIGGKKQKEALRLYYDLLATRQAPAMILSMIIRQFNILLILKLLSAQHLDNKVLAAEAGVPPFTLKNYLAQAKGFSVSELKQAVEYGTDLEERFKTGRIDEQLACELLIIKYSMPRS